MAVTLILLKLLIKTAFYAVPVALIGAYRAHWSHRRIEKPIELHHAYTFKERVHYRMFHMPRFLIYLAEHRRKVIRLWLISWGIMAGVIIVVLSPKLFQLI